MKNVILNERCNTSYNIAPFKMTVTLWSRGILLVQIKEKGDYVKQNLLRVHKQGEGCRGGKKGRKTPLLLIPGP